MLLWILAGCINHQRTQIADLQESIKSHQEESSKAKDELRAGLTSIEQLKEEFKTEHANWDTKKGTLLKRAEDAESALKPVAEEVSGLKRQVNAMTSTVFGKYS